ncbi:hypothetical protein AUP68_02520 [Ilyonectria robusta]
MHSVGQEVPHVRIHPQCGACGAAFRPGESIGALIKVFSSPSSASYKWIDALTFPDHGYCHQRDPGRLFCRFSECQKCALAIENATIHLDCFNLFAKRCQAADKLQIMWAAAIWRSPWHQAPLLSLTSRSWNVDEIMDHIVEIYNLPELKSLPAEIKWMVYDYCQPDLLSRYFSVLKLAGLLSNPQPRTVDPLPLCDIREWNRGGRPVTEKRTMDSTICLTIDPHGLQRIDRDLLATGRFKSRRDDVVFLVESAERLSKVYAEFKLGLARLRLPNESPIMAVWDTPNPPYLASERFMPLPQLALPEPRHPCTRFATIDLSNCTGITFFISFAETLAIHVHTPRTPCALTTFQRLSSQHQRSVAWVYLPLGGEDSITAFGLRFRKHQGQTLWTMPCFLDFVSKIKAGSVLFYGIHDATPVLTMGAYPLIDEDVQQKPLPPGINPPFKKACFSSASLESVERAEVFYDEESRLCKGIVIHYLDGTRRSLGQCRVGLDPTQTYTEPSHFCYAYPRVGRDGLEVQFTTDSEHKHWNSHELEWACYQMAGVLQFWFTKQQVALNFVNN